MKMGADIHFIKTCKRENIVLTSAKVKHSIKHCKKKKNCIRNLPDLLWKQNCNPNIKLKGKSKEKLTLYCIILRNGQTYFKNLAVFTPQDF